MQWLAQASANIALIKYMGKKDTDRNLPDNPSLSYTLPRLISNVLLETHASKKDYWEPLYIPGVDEFNLSEAAQVRFLAHLGFLKKQFGYQGAFIVRSSNNFPHSSGLASSASSFAALTKCAVMALCELTHQAEPSVATQAQWSRLGSGSSCRSFFAPWALWEDENVGPIELPYPELIHQVIIISHAEKHVPSTKAHALIQTSPEYASRPERAKHNLQLLLQALEAKNWSEAYLICWREFQDMHHLFTTCTEPFSYITPENYSLLNQLKNFWSHHGDGPIVTMDAGPNIHLLYRPDQADMARQFKQDYLIGNYDVL